jgi:hypothetical protein
VSCETIGRWISDLLFYAIQFVGTGDHLHGGEHLEEEVATVLAMNDILYKKTHSHNQLCIF